MEEDHNSLEQWNPSACLVMVGSKWRAWTFNNKTGAKLGIKYIAVLPLTVSPGLKCVESKIR
jgi:hypothetical protein